MQKHDSEIDGCIIMEIGEKMHILETCSGKKVSNQISLPVKMKFVSKIEQFQGWILASIINVTSIEADQFDFRHREYGKPSFDYKFPFL